MGRTSAGRVPEIARRFFAVPRDRFLEPEKIFWPPDADFGDQVAIKLPREIVILAGVAPQWVERSSGRPVTVATDIVADRPSDVDPAAGMHGVVKDAGVNPQHRGLVVAVAERLQCQQRLRVLVLRHKDETDD